MDEDLKENKPEEKESFGAYLKSLLKSVKNNTVWQYLLWILQGILVGFGAILPGISGGALLVAFGLYKPVIFIISHIKEGLRKYFFMFLAFFIGVGIGFVGLAGLVDEFMTKNEVIVTCFFIGFIIGTVPELWSDAGEQGRNKFSYIALGVSLIAMVLVLALLNSFNTTMPSNIWGFAFCGVMWGLSFIVPGLSSSSLLLFFNIYQPMMNGIKTLDFACIIPLGICALLTMLILSKIVSNIFNKFYSVMSHCVLGFVLATTIMLVPRIMAHETFALTPLNILFYIGSIILGAIISFLLTILCAKLKRSAEEREKQREEATPSETND